MPAVRRVRATFDQVAPARQNNAVGVTLGFQPLRMRKDMERIEDFADLGPDLSVAAVRGLGKVLRILRAARIALPKEPIALLGPDGGAMHYLERALGTSMELVVRPRSRLRFVAWTELGVETVEDISEVIEGDDAFLVLRPRGHFPVRVPREAVIRQRTECHRWFEVLSIERT